MWCTFVSANTVYLKVLQKHLYLCSFLRVYMRTHACKCVQPVELHMLCLRSDERSSITHFIHINTCWRFSFSTRSGNWCIVRALWHHAGTFLLSLKRNMWDPHSHCLLITASLFRALSTLGSHTGSARRYDVLASAWAECCLSNQGLIRTHVNQLCI